MKLTVNRTDLLITALIAVLTIFLSFKAFPLLEGVERIIYSIEMRLDLPRSVGENKIAIVNIDEKSLNQLGPWPWPRSLVAEMIRILKDNGAKLIGLDLVFSQKEQNQGLKEVKGLYEAIARQQETNGDKSAYAWVLEKLKRIEEDLDNDKKLSQTVKESGNIILPVVGKFGQYDTELVIPNDSFLDENSLKATSVGRKLEQYISVNQLTTPFPELSENSRGIGHINLPPDEVMAGQVHLPFINYRGHIIPSMPIRLALDYLNKYPKQVVVQSESIKLDKRVIPTTKGEIFVKFKGGRKSFPYYSFVDILKVKKVPAVFDGKIVLIGFTAEEGGDSIHTPVDPKMPRVELTANIIEGFINGRYLKRPESMPYIEALVILMLCFLACFLFPKLDYFSRTAILGAMFFGMFITGLILFMSLNIWFKIVYICFSLATLYVVFLVKETVISQKTLALSSKESFETNRMLGLSLQSQGLLDLAFEKLRKCPLDDDMKDVLYNLGLDFERKRMMTKAISVYEYIVHEGENFRDLDARIPKLRKFAGEMPLGKHKRKDEGKLVISDDLDTKPTVGRYEILGELGQGAMGVVYIG